MTSKLKLLKMNILYTIGRMKVFFLRGHSSWFVLILQVVNFTLIFFNYLFITLGFIPEELKTYGLFFFVFLLFYIPICIIFGYLDMKRGSYSSEINVYKEYSPIWKDLFQKLDQIEKKLSQK